MKSRGLKIASVAKMAIFYYTFTVIMETPPLKPNKSQEKIAMVNFAMEFGFIIAIPLIVFAFAGKWLDSRFGTTPWLTLAGIALAITSTTIWMTRRLKGYIKK